MRRLFVLLLCLPACGPAGNGPDSALEARTKALEKEHAKNMADLARMKRKAREDALASGNALDRYRAEEVTKTILKTESVSALTEDELWFFRNHSIFLDMDKLDEALDRGAVKAGVKEFLANVRPKDDDDAVVRRYAFSHLPRVEQDRALSVSRKMRANNLAADDKEFIDAHRELFKEAK